MAIPYTGDNSVQASLTPTPLQNISPSANSFGAQTAEAVKALGSNLDKTGDVLAERALAFQGLQNEAMAKDADTSGTRQLVDILHDPQAGYFSKFGKDAVDSYGSTMKQLEKVRQDTKATLPNPEAQKLFDNTFARRLDYAMGDMAGHASQQNRKWMQDSSEARIDTAKNLVSLDPANNARFTSNLGVIKSEVEQQGEMWGQAPDTVKANLQKQTSAAWETRIRSLATSDPIAAQDMYRHNVSEITGDKAIALEQHLQQMVKPVEARTLAHNVLSGSSTMDVDKLVSAVISKESGGNISAISGKGATGIMQLMPDTAREVAEQLNVPFDADKLKNDAEYNKVLGVQYLKNMGARYGGNQTLALAAYNAGPANVDKWIAQFGNPNAGQISNEEFTKKIPFSETQDYVQTINAKVPPNPGTIPTASDIRKHEEDMITSARQTAKQLRPNDPVFEDMAVTQVKSYTSQIIEGDRLRKQDNGNTLLAMTMGNGDPKNSIKSFDSLVSTPQGKEAWAAADPETQSTILSKIRSNARGEESRSPTPQDSALYYQMLGKSTSSPEEFRKTDLTPLAKVLPYSQWEDLAKRQTTMNKSSAGDFDKPLKLSYYRDLVSPIISEAGINTQKDKPRYEKFLGQFEYQLRQFQDEHKKDPKDDDVRRIASNLVAVDPDTKRQWFGSNKAFFEERPDLKTRDTVVNAFKKVNNGRTPTEDEINRLYVSTIQRLKIK